MTKDKVRQILKDGGCVLVSNIWGFTAYNMQCSHTGELGPCCYDNFKDIEEALQEVDDYCNGDYSVVEEL